MVRLPDFTGFRFQPVFAYETGAVSKFRSAVSTTWAWTKMVNHVPWRHNVLTAARASRKAMGQFYAILLDTSGDGNLLYFHTQIWWFCTMNSNEESLSPALFACHLTRLETRLQGSLVSRVNFYWPRFAEVRHQDAMCDVGQKLLLRSAGCWRCCSLVPPWIRLRPELMDSCTFKTCNFEAFGCIWLKSQTPYMT